MKTPFALNPQLTPSGDQPKAIEQLCKGFKEGKRTQVLLGVTGSGKTFTMANIIAQQGVPALILAPNKTLAAQLYSEMKVMFPKNAVEYFVSYYDYYQPEAYVPTSDTFIEKDSAINEQIEQLRLGATKALLERDDVVVIASVSAIYGLGDPEVYKQSSVILQVGETYVMPDLLRHLCKLQYRRNRTGVTRGDFAVNGEIIDIFPAEEENRMVRLNFFGDRLESLWMLDPLTGEILHECDSYTLYPRTHYVTAQEKTQNLLPEIIQELKQVHQSFLKEGKYVEAQRIQQRTEMDLEMLKEIGFCNGIENYSRFFCGRLSGEPPPTLFEYFPSHGILFVDESHVTLPQIRAMHRGDAARKSTLVAHGFRLPSALDNRPLTFEEFEKLRPKTLFVSATPGPYELESAQEAIVQQVVRPTGLLDPEIEVRPTKNQIIDLCSEINQRCERNERTCVLTLTKKMSEDLTHYLSDQGIKAQYLHSEIDTLERVEILKELRLGKIDVLVGINLLREGLDLPEVSLIAILDADKEGFLRSKTALIQIIGRAARHLSGRAILYGDVITPSMQSAIDETYRRRLLQMAYNEKHGLIPQPIVKSIRPSLHDDVKQRLKLIDPHETNTTSYSQEEILALKEKMQRCAESLEFEQALKIQEQLKAAGVHDVESAGTDSKKTRYKRRRRKGS